MIFFIVYKVYSDNEKSLKSSKIINISRFFSKNPEFIIVGIDSHHMLILILDSL